MLLVRQHFPDRRITDIPAEVGRQMRTADLASRLRPGSRIAIGVGSRGIANIDTIVRSVVDFWKAAGMLPFLFPAMGSHGAATAEGQAAVLAHYGIRESTMGCPIISSLDVVPLGRTPEGIEAFMDRTAFESDGVMLVSRIKWHTDFTGKIESGLFKMMGIGLGKLAGAQKYHTHAFRLGMEAVVRSVGRQVLASGKMLGGLAILEDANHNTAKLEAVPVESMEQREEELQALVKSWKGRLPVNELDLLIVDEAGKNISGTGMDTKVINRSIRALYNPFPDAPVIQRVFLRDLHPMSYGNAVGIGMADVVHDRILERIDWSATHVNSLTASTPAGIRTPIHFRTDRECIEKFAPTVGKLDLAQVTIGWIRNTNQLNLLALSENVLSATRDDADIEIVGDPWPLPFDPDGNLTSPIKASDQLAHTH
jgi:hypothetical protein